MSTKTLLLALQPEPGVEGLVEQAAAWARRLEMTLDLGTVAHTRLSTDPLFAPSGGAAASLAEVDAQRAVLDWLDTLLAQVPDALRGKPQLLEAGPIAPALAKAAESYDLLAMGTHHRTDAARLFLGSTAEALVRLASTPLLVLPRTAQPVPTEGPLKIRVPFDPAHGNGEALKWIDRFLPSAEPVAVYVLPWLQVFGPSPTPGEQIYDHAMKQLGSALAKVPSTAPHVVLIRPEMNAGDAIAHEAKDSGAHLIAMPTHGRTGIIRAVLGSTCERTIRAADTAVLVVR